MPLPESPSTAKIRDSIHTPRSRFPVDNAKLANVRTLLKSVDGILEDRFTREHCLTGLVVLQIIDVQPATSRAVDGNQGTEVTFGGCSCTTDDAACRRCSNDEGVELECRTTFWRASTGKASSREDDDAVRRRGNAVAARPRWWPATIAFPLRRTMSRV